MRFSMYSTQKVLDIATINPSLVSEDDPRRRARIGALTDFRVNTRDLDAKVLSNTVDFFP